MSNKNLKNLTILAAVGGVALLGACGWQTLQIGQQGARASVERRLVEARLTEQRQRALTMDQLGVAADIEGTRLLTQLSTRIENIAREHSLQLFSLNVDPMTKPVDTGRPRASKDLPWSNHVVGFSLEGDVRNSVRAIAAILKLETPIQVDEVSVSSTAQPNAASKTVTTVKLSVLTQSGGKA